MSIVGTLLVIYLNRYWLSVYTKGGINPTPFGNIKEKKQMNKIPSINNATAQLLGKPELKVDDRGNVVILTNPWLGGHVDKIDASYLQIRNLENGQIQLQAGVQMGDVENFGDQIYSDAEMVFMPIEGFFAKCPFAKPDFSPDIVVVEQNQFQALLEWAIQQTWNVQVELADPGFNHIRRAWLP